MLSKKSYKYLGAHFKIAYTLSALPFKWNSKTRSLSCSTSKGQLGIWYLNQLFSVLIAFKYIYIVVLAAIDPETRPLDKLVFDSLLVVPFTALVIWNLTLVFQRVQIADLFNQILKLDQLYTDQYCTNPAEDQDEQENLEVDPKSSKEETDGCDANIFASLSMMFVYAALVVSMFLKNPTDSRYWYNELVALSGDTSAMMLYNWATMEYLQLVRFCFVFNNIFYIYMLYAHTTNFWLHQLSRPKPDQEVNKVLLTPVQPHHVLKIYKAQRVLNKHLNECCRNVIFPAFKVLNVLLHIMASYVTIMFHDRLPLGGFMIFPIGFFMWLRIENDVYPLLGNIHELSGSYLTSWRPTLKAERELRALPQIGIMVSNAYMIEKDTVLSVWSFVSGQVVNLIVMTP